MLEATPLDWATRIPACAPLPSRMLKRFVSEVLRVLKPGGRLVALCANGPRQNASLRPMVEAHGGEWEELPADTEFANSLVPFDSPGLTSSVATRTIQAGEPLTESAIGAPGSVTGQRVMSISLESWQAANGELQVGDQIVLKSKSWFYFNQHYKKFSTLEV